MGEGTRIALISRDQAYLTFDFKAASGDDPSHFSGIEMVT